MTMNPEIDVMRDPVATVVVLVAFATRFVDNVTKKRKGQSEDWKSKSCDSTKVEKDQWKSSKQTRKVERDFPQCGGTGYGRDRKE